MASAPTFMARARTDADDRFVEADELLAGLQQRCGGELPGKVAIPELLALVKKARTLGLRLARTIQAVDGTERIKAWVEVEPENGAAEGGCEIGLATWQTMELPEESEAEAGERRIEIDRSLAELTARLDPQQRLLAVGGDAADLRTAIAQMASAQGAAWTDFVAFPGNGHAQPLHWRLLDGARCRIAGSDRDWTVSLLPLGAPEPGSAGFELFLVADRPLPPLTTTALERPSQIGTSLGRDLSPVLRQPISRIIANAETIRTRLAGPLSDEYSEYAADIAAAGQHLLALIDDLTDLEVVEADDFTTAPDRIDLAEVARQAAGILGVQARERQVRIEGIGKGETLLAIGEFRRVLQVLLNLLGNAIRYSPRGSTVSLELERIGDRAYASVADEGPGLSAEQQQAVFRKFERLGRSGDGGSGLGLYISRCLATAMDGDLTVVSRPGDGARFTLELPAFDDRRSKPR